MATPRLKIPLKIVGATQAIPASLHASGKACLGDVTYLGVPGKRSGCLVHEIPIRGGREYRVWSANGSDSPTAPHRVVALEDAIAALDKCRGKIEPASDVTPVKGRWRGYMACEAGEPPRVTLIRDVDGWGRIVLVSDPKGWNYVVHARGPFGSEIDQVKSGEDVPFLGDALHAAWRAVQGEIGKACALERVAQRQAGDWTHRAQAEEKARKQAEKERKAAEKAAKPAKSRVPRPEGAAPAARKPAVRATEADRAKAAEQDVQRRLDVLHRKAKQAKDKEAEKDRKKAERQAAGPKKAAKTPEEKAAWQAKMAAARAAKKAAAGNGKPAGKGKSNGNGHGPGKASKAATQSGQFAAAAQQAQEKGDARLKALFGL